MKDLISNTETHSHSQPYTLYFRPARRQEEAAGRPDDGLEIIPRRRRTKLGFISFVCLLTGHFDAMLTSRAASKEISLRPSRFGGKRTLSDAFFPPMLNTVGNSGPLFLSPIPPR